MASSMSRCVAETMRVSTGHLAPAADALHRAFLENTKELHLHVGRHVADLVQKERAAVGILEAAALLADGAGEGALLMAEQFRFEQIPRDRAAIDGDIGFGGAVALEMDCPGNHLLATARRAGDDYGGRARRDLADEVANLDHRAADADQQGLGRVRNQGHERMLLEPGLSEIPRI
jgi:hypothetical protein